MRKDIIIRHIGLVLLFNAFFMFISAIISLFLKENSLLPLIFSGIICLIFGFLPILFVQKDVNLSFNEGISVIVLGWFITCIIGMLPYLMWGGEFTLANAFFESVSGYTTTGSTILNDVEALPKGLLFWRSSTHFIGGIGIILFVLLFLPQTKSSRVKLFRSEMSELSQITFHFKANKVLQMLMMVYVGLTLAEIILLIIFGMDIFDAVNHAFATVATGGFSTKNLSVAYFDNVYIEIIIMVFMVLSGMHFGLIYGTFTGSKENIFNSTMAKTFLLILVIGIILVAFKLYVNEDYGWWDSLRYGSFQVISVGTTTGFATADTANWPSFTQIILIYFIIQCAMVGSTSGGLKFDRIFIFFKSISKQITTILHPRAVVTVKVDGYIISDQLVTQTILFIVLYVFVFFTSTFLLTAMNIDNMTAFSASITTLGNVGPGFERVSSMGNFGSLPDTAKYILSANMLLGRLEIFNILILIFISRGR